MMKTTGLSRRMIGLMAVGFLFFAWNCSAAVGQRQKTSSPYDGAIATSRAAVRDMMNRASVPGVGVAVAVDGAVVWSEGFGFADLESRVPVTTETKFGIGSITKSLTTALFARLVEEGKIDWDAPVEKYLPDFPHKTRGVTPRLIAGHLSGLGDEFDSANFYTTRHFETTDEALKEILKEPLRSRPGSEHFYSTGSYTVLAGVIEKGGGRDFKTAMTDLVLRPLGLGNTVPNDRKAIIERRTAFYVTDDQGKTVNAPWFDPSFKLAGAGYLSTAEDMARFGSALLKPGFLKQGSLDDLFRPLSTSDGTQTEFGLGWRVGTDDSGRRIFHQPGGGAGISCWLYLHPVENMVIVLLANQTRAPIGGKAYRTIAAEFTKRNSRR